MEVSRKSITYFEDLSNEILYEIFDLLDFCQVYDVFSNLNKRFQNLFIHSSLPIDVNLSFISKSTFQRYYTHIIIPNQHRIKSLQLNNPFITDSIFLSVNTELKLNRLEKLILHNIGSKYSDNLFNYLASLPYLFSLTIMFKHPIRKKSILYDELFRLPVLKYCQVSLNGVEQYEVLPYATNRFSPIEIFIMKDRCSLQEFYILLSYLPQLRHLYAPYLFELKKGKIESNFLKLNRLTYLYLDNDLISFESLEIMIQDLFPHLQVLYFSTKTNGEYFDANRWKRLITTHMPYLKVFDIQLSYCLMSSENIDDYMIQIDEFQSSFWSERHWFFENHIYHGGFECYINLFSTNPYRRHKHILHEEQSIDNNKTISVNSVHHIEIAIKSRITNSIKYFPNVTELTISCFFTKNDKYSLSTALKHIFPLNQLTKVTLNCYYDYSAKIIELIRRTPNLRVFYLNRVSSNSTNLLLIEQDETFQTISQTNNVEEMSITLPSTLEEMKFFTKLFPRLQCLTIDKPKQSFHSILRFLLSKDNVNTPNLFLLNIKNVEDEMMNNLIESNNLVDDYLIEITIHKTLTIFLWR